jgi:hypothetical protein
MWRPTTSPTYAWVFCSGFRNLRASIGAIIIGLVIFWAGDEEVGRAVVVTALAYVLLASLSIAIADLLGLWRSCGGSMLGTRRSNLAPGRPLAAAF